MPRHTPRDVISAFVIGQLSDCRSDTTSIRDRVLYSYEMPIACYCTHYRVCLSSDILPSATTRKHAGASRPHFWVERLPLPHLTLPELDAVHTGNIQHMRAALLYEAAHLNNTRITPRVVTLGSISRAVLQLDAVDKHVRLYASTMLPAYRFTYASVYGLLTPEIAAVAALSAPASY